MNAFGGNALMATEPESILWFVCKMVFITITLLRSRWFLFSQSHVQIFANSPILAWRNLIPAVAFFLSRKCCRIEFGCEAAVESVR